MRLSWMRDLIRQFSRDMSSISKRSLYVSCLLRNIPAEVGVFMRRSWYAKRFQKAGKNLRILSGCVILNPGKIVCGDNVSIGMCNFIQAGGELHIGSDVMLGPYVKIWTQNHNFEDGNKPVRTQGYIYKPVTIGDDVWVGADSFIMPGASLGNKCIVSACSVVGGKTYPDGYILAGHPARKIGLRSEAR